ncbi:MAG: tail fiber domain-containing protein, partial [Pseudobdellovibrionaceae bacterium]
NGTGTALQDFTCSLNQVISFDASGNAVCANVSALSGAILNGGNTTGADISIGTNDNKALKLKANNSIAMTISQNGNIGIGTTAPGAALDIGGNLRLLSTGNIQHMVNGTFNFTDFSGNNILSRTNVGAITLGGAVGSTVNIPSTLGGGARVLSVAPQINYSSAADYTALDVNVTENSVPTGNRFLMNLRLGGTSRLAVTAPGNVGIGISSPSSALDISGAMTAQGMPSAPSVSATNTGRIYYDFTANKFKVSQNGAAYTDLVASGGITSLGGETGATQTLAISVDNSVSTPTLTSASNAHTWKIPLASNAGTTAGLLNKTDYDLFAAKLGTTTSFAGDVSGAYNATIVQRIQGKAVAAATVSGQMMIYNGTSWANNVISGDATLADTGVLTLNKVPISKGGTNATTFGNNRIIASNGTGTALQDFTCSLNQVITFDGSGNAVCANIISIFPGILNGGNSFASDISFGTNDNYALKFKVNNNTIAMTISQSGNVGVGTASPASLFSVGASNQFQVNSSGNILWSDTIAPTIAISDRTTDAVTNSLSILGQNAFSGAATSISGGAVIVQGGNAKAAGVGGNAIIKGGSSTSWVNTGMIDLSVGYNGTYSTGIRIAYDGYGGNPVIAAYGAANSLVISPSITSPANSVVAIGAGTSSGYGGGPSPTNDFENSAFLKIAKDASGHRLVPGALKTLTIKSGSGNAGTSTVAQQSGQILTLQGGDSPVSTYSTNPTLAGNGGDMLLRGGDGGRSQDNSTRGNGGNIYVRGGKLNATGAGGAVGNVILAHDGTTAVGNVGIGAIAPQTTLQVAGVISPATNNSYSLGNATYRFTEVYATNGVINTSDRREKKDISNTTLGLHFINKLRPVSYRWNTGIDNDVHYGLIAQETEEAISQTLADQADKKTSIVTHDGKTDRYGVRYSELISPLIKAVQEIYQKLVGIDRQVASLKVENALKDNIIAELKAKALMAEQENAAIKARLDKIEKALKSK